MPRFTDEWVVDRTLFEFVNGGSCACCGFNHLFMPNGVAGMIHSISDLETDAAETEVYALQNSPWPPEMREQVWADRVRLRLKLKQSMSDYSDFWKQHGDDFVEWIKTTLTPKQLKKLLQVPRAEITDSLRSNYNIHSAFGIVLCAVTEQVANFSATSYEMDGIGSNEVEFEDELIFDKRGGFTLKILNQDKTVNEETLQVLLNRIQSLGNGKLLDRGVSTRILRDDDEDDDSGADEPDVVQESEKAAKPSFRSDRRIVRLLVARYWADALKKKYLKYNQDEKQVEGLEEKLLEENQ